MMANAAEYREISAAERLLQRCFYIEIDGVTLVSRRR